MDTTKLKPFNLERALAGDPVVTRIGAQVHNIAHFPSAHYGRIVAQIDDDNNPPSLFYPDGSYSNGGTSVNDLFMAPKTRTVWVNLYITTDGNYGKMSKWNTEQEADDKQDLTMIRLGNRAFPIEIEE